MATPDPLPTGARVLIVRLSALGDVLFALETVASLAAERPDVRIDFLVEERFSSVLDGHPQLQRVLTVPRRPHPWRTLQAIRRLRATRYDAVLDLHGILKAAIPARLCRARQHLGFAPPAAREGADRLYDFTVGLPDPLPHRAARGAFLLRSLGLSAEPAPARLPAPAEPSSFWQARPHPRVVLHPGTSNFASFKRWPPNRHAELARRLVARGIEVAVSHGPGEAQLAETIADAAPPARTLDGGAIGLLGLADTYRGADVMVAADTGPLHLAATAGTRVVALFGPKDPGFYGPRGVAAHALLFHDVPCRPCRRRTCVSPQCILGIEIDAVERAVLAHL